MTTIDRHGAAIDADLHSQFGMCLAEWFRKERTWKHLFRLLGQLGSDSRWYKAQMQDPEVAASWAQRTFEREQAEDGDAEKWRPALADWNFQSQLLVALINEIRSLRFQMSDGKTRPPTFPYPETEYDRQLAALRQEKDAAYMDRLMSWVEEGQERWRQQQNKELN